jgi:hypothetical protein
MSGFKIFFAWYDFWIGMFWDSKKKFLYICLLPCVVIRIRISKMSAMEIKHAFPCGACKAKSFEEAGDLCRGLGSCPGENMSREVFYPQNQEHP